VSFGVAVLGTFLVFERRREFAVLEAVGAERSQPVIGPAEEGFVAVLGSLAIGLPLGLFLAILSVRVLGLFFTLPPPIVSIPALTLSGFVALMILTSAVAIGASLIAVGRVGVASVLREP
jgi:putative ABC transport system permease protein